MKRLLLSAALMASPLLALAVNVGVTVNLGDPNFYGQIDMANAPPPPVLYGTPVMIQPVPAGVVIQPIYLRVPEMQSRNWRRYCRAYNACGVPVYFVQENWYSNVYAPQYRSRYMQGHGYERHDDRRFEEHRDEHREERRDEHRDERLDDRR